MNAGKVIRGSTAAVVVGVAGVAAYVSYRHAFELASTHGEDHTTALFVPGTVDGLIFAASMVMLDAVRNGRRIPALARWTLALGIAASLAANVMHGIGSGPIGAIVAGWPALALILAYELLMKLIRDSAQTNLVDNVNDVTALIDLPDSAGDDVNTDEWPDTPEYLVNWTVEQEHPEPPADDEEQVLSEARERFSQVLSAGSVPSIRAIKRELSVGHPKAKRIRAALAARSTVLN